MNSRDFEEPTAKRLCARESGRAAKERGSMTEKGPGRSPRRPSRNFPSTKFWPIAKHEKGGMEVFTLDPGGRGGKESLPVFSFEEEARTFLRFGVPANAGWRVKKTRVG